MLIPNIRFLIFIKHRAMKENTRKTFKPLSFQHILFACSFLVFCVISKEAYTQQWSISYLPHTRYINVFSFLDSSHVVVAGGSEANGALEDIFKSNTAGLTW